METFNLKIDEKNYQINVIEPMDKYGEDNKTYFSEVPLIEFKSEDGKFTSYDVIDVLDHDTEITLANNDTPISLDDRKVINDKLFEIYPSNYLNTFAKLKRHKKPKI